MAFKGYKLNNLYKDAENDIIDDLKDELNHYKKRIKEFKYREEHMEEDGGHEL